MCRALLGHQEATIIRYHKTISGCCDRHGESHQIFAFFHFKMQGSPSQAMKCMPGIRRCFVNSADDINAETPR